jgi:tetraacyldisaccharide 4'-kinase
MIFPLPIRLLLWPISVVYGWVTQVRALLYDKGVLQKRRLNGAVISVGNLTVGGTGKTPMVVWLAEKFLAAQKRVAILTRGYKGSSGTSDEVELMKRRLGERVAFGVGTDRYAEGRRLESQGAIDVFLLDDGFQHLQLARDVDILMLDGSKKIRGEWLLPAGSLREPISACSRADLTVVNRKHERPDIQARDSLEHHIFYAQTRLLGFRRCGQSETPFCANQMGEGPFFAFCGIGNPEAFFQDLQSWHMTITGKRKFRDHHRYRQGDIRELEQLGTQSGAKALITTEKDEQNLKGMNFTQFQVYVAVIELAVASESEFEHVLEKLLSERRRPS